MKKVPLGTRFGFLVSGEYFGAGKRGHALWTCFCDCGKTIQVSGPDLLSGKRKSCGHLRTTEVLTGRQFNDWLVIGPQELKTVAQGRRRSFYLCRCKCGLEQRNPAAQLLNNSNKRCRSCAYKNFPRKPRGVAARNCTYSSYRTQARTRKLPWLLSNDEFDRLTKLPCRYCGVDPSNVCKNGHGEFVYSGIDRADNSRGYEPDNVVPCCRRCNRAKDVMSAQDFISWAKRIAAHCENK